MGYTKFACVNADNYSCLSSSDISWPIVTKGSHLIRDERHVSFWFQTYDFSAIPWLEWWKQDFWIFNWNTPKLWINIISLILVFFTQESQDASFIIYSQWNEWLKTHGKSDRKEHDFILLLSANQNSHLVSQWEYMNSCIFSYTIYQPSLLPFHVETNCAPFIITWQPFYQCQCPKCPLSWL